MGIQGLGLFWASGFRDLIPSPHTGLLLRNLGLSYQNIGNIGM